MTIGRAEFTANFERWRVRDPSIFLPFSFRTHDVGRQGFSKRIAGKLRSTGKWATQSILIANAEPIAMKRKLREIAKSLIRGRR
jgi:hypothetical protein